MNESERANLEACLRSLVKKDAIYFGRAIPPKKADGAINAYAKGVVADRVIALHDATVFGGADEGFLVTDAAFYCRKYLGTTVELRFDQVERCFPMVVDGAEARAVQQKDKAPVVFRFPANDAGKAMTAAFDNFWAGIIDLREQGALSSEDRYVIVQDMPEVFRLDYVKMAVLLTLADDNMVDPTELSEIQLLMTRLELSTEARRGVWRFVGEHSDTAEAILQRLEASAPRGAWPVLRISLLKDLMIVARRRGKPGATGRDPFVLRLAKICGVTEDKLGFIDDALAFDDALLSGKAKASDVKKMGADLAAKAGAVGVPIAAVYLSGSVVGLSAAGITSGLAALGFGGLFGLSAMVTGVGTVVLVGVAVFQLIRWLGGSEEKELAALREKLMQEVVKQLQRTVNALLLDLQSLTDEVLDLTRQTSIDQSRLQRLAEDVSAMMKAVHALTQRRDESNTASAPVVS